MDILKYKLKQLLDEKPYLSDFIDSFSLPLPGDDLTVDDYFDSLNEELLEDLGQSRESLKESFIAFENEIKSLNSDNNSVNSITIIGGIDKSGKEEDFEISLKPGDIISIVGPTGSGKSRLLGDIEWVAQKDTPTLRQILINENVPDKKWRFSTEHKLVAQLSQNMNFVIDLTVEEFIMLHAESRFIKDAEGKTKQIIEKANELAGEPFTPDTPVTSLSGGQSRSLMIADTAYLSRSPVILIDEIENAGIDRKKALELLTGKDKIVLMATHDPILALMADRRLIIRNGGVVKLLQTTDIEKKNLVHLEALDNKLLSLRNRIRNGELIETLN